MRGTKRVWSARNRMRLRSKIERAKRPVVMYEIIPPVERSRKDLASYAERLSRLLSHTHIDAVNIPEVRDETTRGERPVKALPKVEPRLFGALLQEALGIEAVVNRCVVYANRANQQDWLIKTARDLGIENVVLVGGESSAISYPGPSVTEAAEIITRYLNRGLRKVDDGHPEAIGEPTDFFCGGIVIPQRRRPRTSRDEPLRLIRKAEAGLEFFTSQVLYEAESTKWLLRDYAKAAAERGVEPKRIFLSFAPVSSRRDMDFLKWLGVEIPTDVASYVLEPTEPDRVRERSLEVASRVLREILDCVAREGLGIPIGINVEHITRKNFGVSVEMTQKLAHIYRSEYLTNSFLGEWGAR